MGFSDNLEKTEHEEQMLLLTEKMTEAKRKEGMAVRQRDNALAEAATLRKLMDRYATIKPEDMKVPKWMASKKKAKKHHGTAVLMLSDLHLDEVVELDQMDGMNEYNREIAEKRLRAVVDNAIEVIQRYVSGLEIDGIVVPLLGDIVTGDIHEELANTNETAVPATIVHWVPLLAAALRMLADQFGKVYVPCVAGNHDRTTKKTPTKRRMESSYSWIIYSWLADTLRDDPRITFGISTSPEQVISIYETRFLLVHGDAFRSSGGVGGLYPSLLKYLLRKHHLYSQVRQDFHYALLGHWHQLLWGQDFVVNGSLKGYDNYAKEYGFGYEVPQQALFIVTPEHGITQRMPVYAE